MQKQIDVIIFDLDGTLVNSKKDIFNAANYMLRSQSLKEKTFEEIVSYVGKGLRGLLVESLGRDDEDIIKRSIKIYKDYYKSNCAVESELYPNVKDVLECFNQKKMFVVTNRDKDMSDPTLRSFGIDKYFEGVYGGDNGHCLKPSPCALNRVIDSTGTKRDRCVIVGDMDIDIMAGKNTGILTCGVTYGFGLKQEILDARPDYVLDDISQLKTIIS